MATPTLKGAPSRFCALSWRDKDSTMIDARRVVSVHFSMGNLPTMCERPCRSAPGCCLDRFGFDGCRVIVNNAGLIIRQQAMTPRPFASLAATLAGPDLAPL